MHHSSLIDSIENLLSNSPGDVSASHVSDPSLESYLRQLADDDTLFALVNHVVRTDIYDKDLSDTFEACDAISALPALRALRACLGMNLGQFTQQLTTLVNGFDESAGKQWGLLAARIQDSRFARWKTLDFFKHGKYSTQCDQLEKELTETHPHAIYPTSPYRESSGTVVSRSDYQQVEAVMHSTTHTSIRVVENVLDAETNLIRDIYKPLGRCICVIDQNVEHFFGWRVETYFAEHGIELEKLVYRAMEVDKGVRTVERMLGDFKHLGVSRNEPVLIIGGGVLSDVGGLACALYHRGTPYVMLSTSIVAGIDAGPSPRTCCDGFGFKNLFGAYHAPILSITDRTLFQTLHAGWLRHGIAEIIKMATVKDEELFVYLEQAGDQLIETRFGSLNSSDSEPIADLSRKILGRAIKSYVEAEYGNLYETHQCRPHAFGHTWSPGFEIPAGMLHGHAVSVGMGFGVYLSSLQGWIDQEQRERIHRLISSFGLSLWHDVLQDHDMVWAAQEKMIEKRGGHLAAPLPLDKIGRCGYLPSLSQRELFAALRDYRRLCQSMPNAGVGTDPHCADVGLEDPSTVGESISLR